MYKSESIAALAAALSKAQSEIRGAVEESTNPHFRSKYAPLKAYIDAARPALAKNGLSVTQLLVDNQCQDPNMVSMETILLHSSGEFIGSMFSIPAPKKDAQGFGSAITYARRYAYASIIGIAPIDDDGEEAVQRTPVATKTPEPIVNPQITDAVMSGRLPMDVITEINQFDNESELIEYGKASKFAKHPKFRQQIKSRIEEIKNA